MKIYVSAAKVERPKFIPLKIDDVTLHLSNGQLLDIAGKTKNPKLLDNLANHNWWEIRAKVARNANTSSETLARLAKDSKAVSECAKKNPNYIGQSNDTNIQPNVADRVALAKTATDISILQYLSTDRAPSVKAQVARNKNTTADILTDMYNKTKDPYVLMAILENKNISDNLFDDCVNKIVSIKESPNNPISYDHLFKLLREKNKLTDDLADKLIPKLSWYGMTRLHNLTEHARLTLDNTLFEKGYWGTLVENKKTSKEILDKIINDTTRTDGSCRIAKLALIADNRISEDDRHKLIDYILSSGNTYYRVELVKLFKEHPSIADEDVIDELSMDNEPSVRLAVIKRDLANEEQLERLMHDPNDDVKSAAYLAYERMQ